LTEDAAQPFETSLMIDARVISASHPMLVTVDAGLKAMATEAGAPPILAGAPEGSAYHFMGDEHGASCRRGASPRPSSASASPSPRPTATQPSTSTRPTMWSAATPWKPSGR